MGNWICMERIEVGEFCNGGGGDRKGEFVGKD